MQRSHIWIMDADENYAEPMRTALIDKGALIHDFSDATGIAASLRNGPQPHLIIMDADHAGGGVLDLVVQLRNRELGNNPFLMVVLTTWNGDANDLKGLEMTGADAVLSKPFSTQDMVSLIEQMAGAQRHYMACNNYVGPARRGIGPASMKPRLVRVPNDFQLLKRNTLVSPAAIEEAWEILVVEKARLQTGFVVDDFSLAVDATPDADMDEWARTVSIRCKVAANDLRNTPLQASYSLMEAGGVFADSMARDGFRPGSADSKVAGQLAVAIKRSGENRAEDLPFARQIAADMRAWLENEEDA